MEDILNLYSASKLSTKLIIWFYWIVVGFQMGRIFLKSNKVIQLFLIALFYTIYYFIIDFFTAIPINIYIYIYVIQSFVFGLLFFVVFKIYERYKYLNQGPLKVTIPFINGKKAIFDLQKGMSIQGAAGSGKTVSFAGWILEHFGKKDVGGILYDYKDFEFVEMANYYYKDSGIPVHIFAPCNVQKSIQYNPISPDILKTENDILIMAKCIVQNLLGSGKNTGDKFFNDAAEGAIIGCIYSLKEFYPKYCSFTYLTAIFLTKDVEELVSFIEKSVYGSMMARSFLDSQDSAKQMAAIKATLSNAFKNFATAEILYTMSTNSVDFSINEPHNKALFCVVNKPIYDDIYSPVLSVVIQSLILKMSERGRDESFILLDEAPTININRIGKVPATMRSFNVATIYMLQDTIQATIQMGREKMKEVLANLSTIAFGKTNDPETAKFFESYFADVNKKQKSVSFKSGGFGSSDKRTSVSERKEKEHSSYEMFKRDTGEFFVFDDKGNYYDKKIKKPYFENVKAKNLNTISPIELDLFKKKVLLKCKDLV